MRISDPAPLMPDMKPERHRGVHFIRLGPWFMRKSDGKKCIG
jgi:hypothetical protein